MALASVILIKMLRKAVVTQTMLRSPLWYIPITYSLSEEPSCVTLLLSRNYRYKGFACRVSLFHLLLVLFPKPDYTCKLQHSFLPWLLLFCPTLQSAYYWISSLLMSDLQVLRRFAISVSGFIF